MNPKDLDSFYQHFITDLPKFVPDGFVEVNLALLNDLGLLSSEQTIEQEDPSSLTHSFYVIESSDKLTLFNPKFIVWIVPKIIDQIPTTYTLVALNEPEHPHLEMVFTTAGVYNHSNLVLKILEKFLDQIEENEEEIFKIKES